MQLNYSGNIAVHRHLASVCGNGKLEDDETCDDGVSGANVDCKTDCSAAKDTHTCSGGDVNGPSICLENIPNSCGNAVYGNVGEGCDDGNNDDGDGCSRVCKVEPTHTCTTP